MCRSNASLLTNFCRHAFVPNLPTRQGGTHDALFPFLYFACHLRIRLLLCSPFPRPALCSLPPPPPPRVSFSEQKYKKNTPIVSTGLPPATLAPVDGHALRGLRRAGGQHRRRSPESQLRGQGARVGGVDDPQGLTTLFRLGAFAVCHSLLCLALLLLLYCVYIQAVDGTLKKRLGEVSRVGGVVVAKLLYRSV